MKCMFMGAGGGGTGGAGGLLLMSPSWPICFHLPTVELLSYHREFHSSRVYRITFCLHRVLTDSLGRCQSLSYSRFSQPIVCNPKFHYRVLMKVPLVPTWARLIRSISHHPIYLRSILLLSSHLFLGLPRVLFSFWISNRIFCAFIFSPACFILSPSYSTLLYDYVINKCINLNKLILECWNIRNKETCCHWSCNMAPHNCVYDIEGPPAWKDVRWPHSVSI
jgi:hypothetical protein